jgi:hypothetical protein
MATNPVNLLTSSLDPHLPHRVRLSPVPIGNLTPQFPTGQGQVRRMNFSPHSLVDFPHLPVVEQCVSEDAAGEHTPSHPHPGERR